MLITNFENLESELNEVVNEFGVYPEMRVDGELKTGSLAVNVAIDDKTYSYEYAFNPENKLIEKRLKKRYAKLSLYKALSDFTGVKLPWGALTGIRPSKLAVQQGENWRSFFTDEMLVSESKTKIIEDILSVQKPYYPKVGEDIFDFFVSLPFCPTRCAYCSFISCEISKEKAINEYIEALIKEIKAAKALGKTFRSVYVGGGTPVSLKTEHFAAVLDSIGKQNIEYTVEAGRPDCITEEKLKLMKDYGVTRVCVNPQTFSDKTLALIGRKHTAKETIDKFFLTKSYGFDVNMDLIAGLPEETFDDFKASLDKAIELSPENITVHTLCLKKGSKLKESMDRLTGEEVPKMVDYAHIALHSAQYSPYYLYRQKYMAANLENTGYAKKGKECIYNIDIMEEIASILSCGANAVGKRLFPKENRIERLGEPKDIKTYLDKLDKIIEEKNQLFS